MDYSLVHHHLTPWTSLTWIITCPVFAKHFLKSAWFIMPGHLYNIALLVFSNQTFLPLKRKIFSATSWWFFSFHSVTDLNISGRSNNWFVSSYRPSFIVSSQTVKSAPNIAWFQRLDKQNRILQFFHDLQRHSFSYDRLSTGLRREIPMFVSRLYLH